MLSIFRLGLFYNEGSKLNFIATKARFQKCFGLSISLLSSPKFRLDNFEETYRWPPYLNILVGNLNINELLCWQCEPALPGGFCIATDRCIYNKGWKIRASYNRPLMDNSEHSTNRFFATFISLISSEPVYTISTSFIVDYDHQRRSQRLARVHSSALGISFSNLQNLNIGLYYLLSYLDSINFNLG
jgi:hypothetical protein